MLALAALAMTAAISTEVNTPNVRPLQTLAPVAQTEEPIRLEDVEVTGRPLEDLILNFIDEVAAPGRNRSLARWDSQVCVGVSNLRPEAAQYLVDHVQAVGRVLNLRIGERGCRPNVVIVAAADEDAPAATMSADGSRFRMGGAGMDRGVSALQKFRNSDAPVRWWTVSMPVDADTGDRAVRLPGDCEDGCQTAGSYAPPVSVRNASRLNTQVVDAIIQTVVILDIDQVDRVNSRQLADYIAMVVYAQIAPEADTSAYATILNVFEAPETAEGMTPWDLACLQGLYQAERTRSSLRSANHEIGRSIQRTHQRMSSVED